MRTPPWMEKRNGSRADRPMAMPISVAVKLSWMAQSGMITLSIMATPLPVSPTP